MLRRKLKEAKKKPKLTGTEAAAGTEGAGTEAAAGTEGAAGTEAAAGNEAAAGTEAAAISELMQALSKLTSLIRFKEERLRELQKASESSNRFHF